jgi:hypothetical protein
MDIYKTIFYFFVPIWVALQLLMVKWLLDAKPNKAIWEKYHVRIRLLIHYPFYKKWRRYVEKEDIRMLEIYQFRLLMWQLSFIFPFVILIFIFILVSGTWRYGV